MYVARQPHLPGEEQAQAPFGAEGALPARQGGVDHARRVQRHGLGQVCPQLANLQGRGGEARPVPQPQGHQAHQAACLGAGVPVGVVGAGRWMSPASLQQKLCLLGCGWYFRSRADWRAPGRLGTGGGEGGAGRGFLRPGVRGLGDAEGTLLPAQTWQPGKSGCRAAVAGPPPTPAVTNLELWIPPPNCGPGLLRGILWPSFLRLPVDHVEKHNTIFPQVRMELNNLINAH